MIAFRRAQNSSSPEPTPVEPTQQDRGANVLGLFANHTALAKAYFAFSGHISYRSTISPRHRELVILRVAVLRDAHYEWAQHVQMARAEGLTDSDIESILAGGEDGMLSPFETVLVQAVDELVTSTRLSDSTWGRLNEEFGRRELMDLVFTVGAYELLAMAFNSFQLQMEDGLKQVTPRLPTMT